ncbi:unnamed protein product [Arabis nemorensis]|uniref:Uncharacterized protein n=1 Tax=Arabis nemorensis TaxID=586526 RepID=A0A565ATP2_9BRAS|nr:unnamed protein product [Arabis nemorensis]
MLREDEDEEGIVMTEGKKHPLAGEMLFLLNSLVSPSLGILKELIGSGVKQ